MLLDIAAHGANQCGLRISVYRLRTTAQTGPVAGLLGFEGVEEKCDILAAWTFSGTGRTAEDSGAGDTEDECTILFAVASEYGLPAALVGVTSADGAIVHLTIVHLSIVDFQCGWL